MGCDRGQGSYDVILSTLLCCLGMFGVLAFFGYTDEASRGCGQSTRCQPHLPSPCAKVRGKKAGDKHKAASTHGRLS